MLVKAAKRERFIGFANLLGRFQEAEETFFALDLSIRRHEFVLATKAV
jgi:hypothetical protein